MSLSHVLLTSLIEKPCSGYDLARRFDRSMGFFWKASHQQIYRELASMLNKGWVSTLDAPQQQRKKVYQVEQLGRVELANWMLQQSQPAQLREDLMVRLRAEAQLGGNHMLPELTRHLELHQQQLHTYLVIYKKDFTHTARDNRVLFIHRMILQLGIDLEKGWIQWLEQMIAALSNEFYDQTVSDATQPSHEN